MKTLRNSFVFLALGCLVIPALFFGGCSKSLEGDVYANEKPIVWFVNVPPADARSSVNPIVNWMGQDRDGQIDFYRYIVVREDEMMDSLGLDSSLTEAQAQSFVDNYLVNMHDSLWTVLLVRADSTDPHTSNIIPMSAEMSDPVRTYVPQFVFVQVFDEEGLGSDIVFRRFLRNDNPPTTRIVAFIAGVPFINSVLPSGPATGIRIRWQGADVIDYPTDPPPFEFEWKLFGPYSDEEYAELIDSFRTEVFVTNDARVFVRRELGDNDEPIRDSIGLDTFWTVDNTVQPPDSTLDSIVTVWLPTALIICDTSYPNGVFVEECDTIHIDTLESSNIWGDLDTLLRVYDDDFINGVFASTGNRFYFLADSSCDEFGNVWVTNTRDSIYNAYWNHPADTTQAAMFLFVVRCRDDAHVPDLTSSWRGFTVINPQHERDVLVVNWSASAHENKALEDSVATYWDGAINNWINQTGHTELLFDTEIDIQHVSPYVTRNKMLKLILKYKVAIMVQDAQLSGTWSSIGQPVQNTMVALQTGVNVWVAMRVPLGSHTAAGSPRSVDMAPPIYQYFFGVQQTTYPGWGSYILDYFDGYGFGLPRTEHFIGTLSLDTDQWPELSIDTTFLRTRYKWAGCIVPTPEEPSCYPYYPYYPELGALPQVGWCVRTFDTEAMYLFKSLYGNEHGIYTELSFHGRPVGIRLNRGVFRTVHFMFTPLALEATTGQEIVNGVMNWLYDGRVELSSGSRNARQAAVASDLASRYWQAYWDADGDRETFYELLKNAY